MTPRDLVLLLFGIGAGACVGSFTNVVIDRMPLELDEPNEFGETWDTRPWREVVAGASRCSGCGTELGYLDMIPVLTWIMRRGRCHTCGVRIETYHPVVEALVPLLGVVAWAELGIGWSLWLVWWFIPAAVAVAAIDLRVFMVPTRIVWPAFFVTVALTLLAAAIEGQWSWFTGAVLGSLALAAPLFLIWFALPRAMGFGDVRLAVFVGWTVGFCVAVAGGSRWASVGLSLLSLAVASVVGLLVGVVALSARGLKAKVPFGPALVIAGFLCSVGSERLVRWFR